ncbi:S-type pyocin domain-containing protein [Pseudomonas sp. SWRI77]|uniref:S-type pyocin domain-containing protein n=1 Tax=Pseudomonas sp. SWRI77 TaxID=2745485 RepID=UPI0016479695|nr:S-type pyocin domain-containing protein [Pseudomonas sp. SWRI77]MBC3484008.1 S-type pyocin domain-containing protein [Pseudomonas sp. SWRI77]
MQGTVFLPDSHVIGRPPIPVLFPPLFPFGLPHWPYPAGGPLVPALPPNSPPAMPNSAQILEAIHEDAKKPLDLRTLAAAVDVEIESAIVEAGLNRDNATHRRQIIESLAIRKLDALETHEANVNKLVGHHPLWKSTAATIIAYEQRYGSIDDDPELFIQRITYSYAAARSRDYAAVEIYYFSTLLAGSTTEEIRARVNARALVEAERIAAKAAAKAEAERIAAEAAAKAEAERIAAEAAAKAEAERIAAEAAAKAEAERIAAETELIRLANTYSASGSVAVTGSVIITAVGTVVSTSAEYLLRGVIGAAVGAVSGFTASVGAGFVVGVSALFYSPNLGNGELPRRYSLQTPLSDLDPQLSVQLAASAAASASYIDLPYRFSSQLNANDDSEIFAVKTGGEVVPSQVRILTASYDTQRNVYTATTADVPPRTLTWTPIVTPGDSSTGLPADQRDTPSAIHEPHLPPDGASIYRCISGEQFHGSSAS